MIQENTVPVVSTCHQEMNDSVKKAENTAQKYTRTSTVLLY